jgi:hypothetical protein
MHNLSWPLDETPDPGAAPLSLAVEQALATARRVLWRRYGAFGGEVDLTRVPVADALQDALHGADTPAYGEGWGATRAEQAVLLRALEEL